MRGWVRLIFAVAALAAWAMAGLTPVGAQAPAIPQQAPTGTTAVGVNDIFLQPGADVVRPSLGGEVVSVTSSDPSVVAVDAQYSSFGGTWNLNYECKKAGVTVVTVVLKNGNKYAQLVGCGVTFPLQDVNYTQGHYNSHSYLAWVDQKGTLTVSGAYQDSNGTMQPMNISIPGYAPPKSTQTPVPPKAPPSQPFQPPRGAEGGGGD